MNIVLVWIVGIIIGVFYILVLLDVIGKEVNIVIELVLLSLLVIFVVLYVVICIWMNKIVLLFDVYNCYIEE